MYSAIAVANYFYYKGVENNKPFSPIKLQKLMYFAYGWYLYQTNQNLFDEVIEAWRNGPIIPSIYNLYNKYSNRIIEEPLRNEDPKTTWDIQVEEILEFVWYSYSDLSDDQLSILTCKKGTPWYKIYEQYGDISEIPNKKEINRNYIKKYFTEKIEQIEREKRN